MSKVNLGTLPSTQNTISVKLLPYCITTKPTLNIIITLIFIAQKRLPFYILYEILERCSSPHLLQKTQHANIN